MMTESRAFSWPVRVYYEDTDAGGVVFYANYLKFFERARTEWLRSLGFEQDQLREQQSILFVVRSVAVDYLKPAKFNDLLQVSASVNQAKKTTLTFQQTVTHHETLLCTANIRIACLNSVSLKPTAIPSSILEQFS
jgi:acyl-CoA thioester hydrolase